MCFLSKSDKICPKGEFSWREASGIVVDFGGPGSSVGNVRVAGGGPGRESAPVRLLALEPGWGDKGG